MIDSDLQRIYNRLQLPELYWESRFSMIPNKPYKEKVLEWSHDHIKDRLSEGKGLYLYGPYRHGKSAIASLVLKSAAAKGVLGLWVNFRNLPAIAVDKKPFDEFQTLQERLEAVDILVIDEFEATVKKWFNIELLENTIRTRHAKKKITIITSNHSPPTLQFSNNAELKNLMGGIMGIFSEAFTPILVEGKHFGKEK